MGAQDSSDSPHADENPTEQNVDTEPTGKRKRDEEERHPLWKTSLCSYFRRSNGSCSHGNECRFAHGETELLIRPDHSWDPTSERAKKMAKNAEDGEEEEGGDIMMTESFAEEDCSVLGTELAKCLRNLPMKWSSDNLRNFLQEQGILFKSAKKKKGMNVGFLSFETAEQVKSAIKELDGKSVGNKNLKVADVLPRSFEKNMKPPSSPSQKTQVTGITVITSDNSNASEHHNQDTDDNHLDNDAIPGSSVLKGRSARDVVTPLAHLPYVDQLEQKKSSLMQTLKRLTRNARKACPNGVPLPEWIHKSREIGGLPCIFEGILESPVINGYRNKCEFSVGYSILGKPTVGFLLGNFREGVTAVQEPDDCPNVSRIACKYAATFQEMLQSSKLPIWNRLNNTGFWRQLTVREGRMRGKDVDVENPESHISEVMLIVQVCTSGFEDELVNSELEGLAKAFACKASDSTSLPLTAFLVQDHTGISNAAPADAPLRVVPVSKDQKNPGLGADTAIVQTRIHDYINDLQFCISPTAFFQVNTFAAEKLYSLAGDWAGLGPDTLLFDICCGTGTIGLTLAHRVGMVVGVEMNASAVSDAQRNAEINGIKNCRFVCAKAEDVMGTLLKEYLTSHLDQGAITNAPEKNDREIKEDGISDPSEKNDGKVATADEEANSSDSTQCRKASGLELESGRASEHWENGIKDPEDRLQSSCISENGTTLTHKFRNVVAIVDPPRVGLHPTVIKVLRTCALLRRLVYISCNPESLVANAIELCTPSPDKTEKGNNKNNRGWRNMSSAGLARHRAKSMPSSEPFKPIKAMAVDLFPHTPHCELVMLLER